MKRKPVDAAILLADHVRLAGLGAAVREYRFAAEHVGMGAGIRERLLRAGLQDWRFDLAWPDVKLACEVDGGAFTAGRHSRGAGMRSDCEKQSTAVSMGWRVLRVLPEHVKSGRALQWIERALRA